ncbi:MAG: DNA double-strand break repair nuclease NurA, partial [Anaerolineae bacterium]
VRDNLEVRKKRYPWLVANPLNSLRDTFAVPPLPVGGYSVAASDGSNIPPDRHSPAQYCVLNVSQVVLTYGENPSASLGAVSEMLYGDENLYLDGEPLKGELLGAKMAVRELEVLLETALALPAPRVALHDGTLILWRLQSEPDGVRNRLIGPLRRALDGFLAERIPLLSYISFPSARDLCNALRVALCDTETSECKTCESDHRELCEFLGELRDRELLLGVLEPGQRTDLFATVSDVVKYYGKHDIVFCYLNVGGEIARLEMPLWVAEDEDALNLGLGVVLDQCALSGDVPPYPLALMEAHEAAVIDVAMRTVVEELVEGEFARRGVPYIRSGKDRSKRRRGV